MQSPEPDFQSPVLVNSLLKLVLQNKNRAFVQRALWQNTLSLPFLMQFIMYYVQINRYIETLQSAFVMCNLKFAIRFIHQRISMIL